jgi:hypothetical protein
MSRRTARLILPSHRLCHHKLIHSLFRVKSTPAAVLHSTKGKSGVIEDRHGVDVHTTLVKSMMCSNDLGGSIQLTLSESSWLLRDHVLNPQ